MRLLHKFFTIFCILIATSFAASGNFGIQTATLKNGMKVIVLKTKARGIVSCGVGYFVGAADDPRSTIGLSHLLEHMMFKGTKHLSGEEIKKILFGHYKGSQAYTGYDFTFYRVDCFKSMIANYLKLAAEQMVNLKISQEDFDSEKMVVTEERKQTQEANPVTRYMQEAAWKCMFLYSKYSYSICGYEDQIEACTRKKLYKHYQRYYHPKNAFVLMVGDITIEEALPFVQAAFGNIPAGPDCKKDRVVDPKQTGLSFFIDNESEQIAVHNLNVIYCIRRELIDTLRKYFIVALMIDILAEGPSSVLYQQLVDKKQISYTTGAHFDQRKVDKAFINLATVFRENQNREDVERAIQSIIKNFVTKYLTKDLFAKKKQQYRDVMEIHMDDPADFEWIILELLINGYQPEEIDTMLELIDSITYEEIVDVFNQIFVPKNKVMRIYSHPQVA
jgi:zinc protease